MKPLPIILDTDPGVGIRGTDADDPIALMLALADSRLALLGVTTTFGNCPPSLGARGAAAVLRAAGRADIPIAVGSGTPLSGRLPNVLIAAYEGERGRPGRIELPEAPVLDVDAADFIVQTVRAHPTPVTLIAIGPHTNIAEALRRAPEIRNNLASIVFMGGALGREPRFGRGNVTPVAECNIYFDPVAAAEVLAAGVPLRMVPLDVTSPVTGMVLERSQIEAIDAGISPVAALLASVCATYLDAPMFEWSDGCVLYDPLAVAVAANPSIATWEEMAIGVETRGELTLGQTVPLREGSANVHVCVGVDGRAVVADILRTLGIK